MTRPRKVHAGEAGYVAERMNPFVPGAKVVIYQAADQGLDVGDCRYAVVCDAHSTIVGDAGLRGARLSMKRPDNFCEPCAALESAGMDPVTGPQMKPRTAVSRVRKLDRLADSQACLGCCRRNYDSDILPDPRGASDIYVIEIDGRTYCHNLALCLACLTTISEQTAAVVAADTEGTDHDHETPTSP